jgi:RND family efflux transporter MFP subunit
MSASDQHSQPSDNAPLPQSDATPEAPIDVQPAAPAEATEILPPKKRRRFRSMLLFGLSGIVTGALALGAVAIGLLSTTPRASQPAVAAQAQTPVVNKPPSVTVARIARGLITETSTVTGSLVPREEVLVAAQVDGLALTEILVEEGDTVTKGQVLARLSRETTDVSLAQNAAQIERATAAINQARSNIDEVRATLDQAERAFERARALVKSGATTVDNIEQREALAKTARARLASAEQSLILAEADKTLAEAQRREWMVRLERTEIKAPADGIITRRTARVGVVVSGAGEPLFRIMMDGDIELEAQVPETTLATLAPGMPARVITVARAKPFTGTVRLISQEVNTMTRLGNVRIAIERAPGLQLGAFGRAEVQIASREGVLAPQSAILYTPGGAEVQVVKNGIVETRKVTIGLRTPTAAEVLEGLAEGEDVVLTAGTFVRNGDRVTPVTAPVAISAVN